MTATTLTMTWHDNGRSGDVTIQYLAESHDDVDVYVVTVPKNRTAS